MPDFPALRAERAELELSIEARQRDLGPDHPDLAADIRALGRLAHELGDFEDAQSLLHRALALYTESMGAEHPETATCINHIGLFLHDLGDPGRGGGGVRAARWPWMSRLWDERMSTWRETATIWPACCATWATASPRARRSIGLCPFI